MARGHIDRTKLVKKLVTDKAGRARYVWVRPDDHEEPGPKHPLFVSLFSFLKAKKHQVTQQGLHGLFPKFDVMAFMDKKKAAKSLLEHIYEQFKAKKEKKATSKPIKPADVPKRVSVGTGPKRKAQTRALMRDIIGHLMDMANLSAEDRKKFEALHAELAAPTPKLSKQEIAKTDPKALLAEHQRMHDEFYGAMKKDPADIRKIQLPQYYKNYMKEIRNKLASGDIKGDWLAKLKAGMSKDKIKEIASGSSLGRRILDQMGFDSAYYGGKEMQDILIKKFKEDEKAKISQEIFSGLEKDISSPGVYDVLIEEKNGPYGKYQVTHNNDGSISAQYYASNDRKVGNPKSYKDKKSFISKLFDDDDNVLLVKQLKDFEKVAKRIISNGWNTQNFRDIEEVSDIDFMKKQRMLPASLYDYPSDKIFQFIKEEKAKREKENPVTDTEVKNIITSGWATNKFEKIKDVSVVDYLKSQGRMPSELMDYPSDKILQFIKEERAKQEKQRASAAVEAKKRQNQIDEEAPSKTSFYAQGHTKAAQLQAKRGRETSAGMSKERKEFEDKLGDAAGIPGPINDAKAYEKRIKAYESAKKYAQDKGLDAKQVKMADMLIEKTKANYAEVAPKLENNKISHISGDKISSNVQNKIVDAMNTPRKLYQAQTGYRDLDKFKNALKGLSKKEINAVMVNMNKPPLFKEPITVEYKPGASDTHEIFVSNGRHRLKTAREMGATHIKANVIVQDNKGTVISKSVAVIPVGEDANPVKELKAMSQESRKGLYNYIKFNMDDSGRKIDASASVAEAFGISVIAFKHAIDATYEAERQKKDKPHASGKVEENKINIDAVKDAIKNEMAKVSAVKNKDLLDENAHKERMDLLDNAERMAKKHGLSKELSRIELAKQVQINKIKERREMKAEAEKLKKQPRTALPELSKKAVINDIKESLALWEGGPDVDQEDLARRGEDNTSFKDLAVDLLEDIAGAYPHSTDKDALHYEKIWDDVHDVLKQTEKSKDGKPFVDFMKKFGVSEKDIPTEKYEAKIKRENVKEFKVKLSKIKSAKNTKTQDKLIIAAGDFAEKHKLKSEIRELGDLIRKIDSAKKQTESKPRASGKVERKK